MPVSIDINEQFGLVLAVASSSFLVNAMHMLTTSRFRKASGVLYPVSYASEEQAAKNKNAYKFNCAQRAHANFTENHTSFLGALLISGLRFPLVAAGLGAAWVFGRVVYLLGYTSDKGPKGRNIGSLFASPADIALRLMAVYTGVQFALGQ
ncbi:unnamed protein product [Clonostachys solani]|uniref:Microsomal glutathione S-transferase 3 n=1 Tax=Clonostachys solani TaxID=160281 RepID=A0A9N9W5V8_9HYPO|nr:unnamed protein product [Clonostachys solani]